MGSSCAAEAQLASQVRLSLQQGGTPSGIRTRDLHLERVASSAARPWGRNLPDESYDHLKTLSNQGLRRLARQHNKKNNRSSAYSRDTSLCRVLGCPLRDRSQQISTLRQKRQGESGKKNIDSRNYIAPWWFKL